MPSFSLLFLIGAYSALCFLLLPPTSALYTSVMASVSMVGVTMLTRAKSLKEAFRWFTAFKLPGLFVVLLTAGSIVLTELYLQASPGELLLQSLLIFFWFWMFAAIGERTRRQVPLETDEATILQVERETLQYRKGVHAVNIGAYGRWQKGGSVDLVVNGRWNPPRTGPVLADQDLADVEQKLRAYAAKNGVTPRITVDRS